MVEVGGLKRRETKGYGMNRMPFTKWGIKQVLNKAFGSFTEFWSIYNGFILMAMIIGIASLFSIFFWGGPAYYVDIRIFFSLNSIIAILGILYIVACCLLFIHLGFKIFKSHGNAEKAIHARANSSLYLSLFSFLAFDIIAYIYFIVLPFPFPQGEVHIFMGPTYLIPPSFEIGPSFMFSLVLTSMIIIGIVYDLIHEKLTLRHFYATYLPRYAPKKQQKIEVSDQL